jgi:hypothetical protein
VLAYRSGWATVTHNDQRRSFTFEGAEVPIMWCVEKAMCGLSVLGGELNCLWMGKIALVTLCLG